MYACIHTHIHLFMTGFLYSIQPEGPPYIFFLVCELLNLLKRDKFKVCGRDWGTILTRPRRAPPQGSSASLAPPGRSRPRRCRSNRVPLSHWSVLQEGEASRTASPNQLLGFQCPWRGAAVMAVAGAGTGGSGTGREAFLREKPAERHAAGSRTNGLCS